MKKQRVNSKPFAFLKIVFNSYLKQYLIKKIINMILKTKKDLV